MTPPTRRRTAIRLAVIVAVIVPSVFGFIQFQRSTDLGIIIFRGSHHWFKLACDAESADESKASPSSGRARTMGRGPVPGRLAVLTGLSLAAGAIPLPILPDVSLPLKATMANSLFAAT